jgi:hypothetical protein
MRQASLTALGNGDTISCLAETGEKKITDAGIVFDDKDVWVVHEAASLEKMLT